MAGSRTQARRMATMRATSTCARGSTHFFVPAHRATPVERAEAAFGANTRTIAARSADMPLDGTGVAGHP
eukprot:564213-Alexandrium_andersonii.AAC.1